MTNYFNNTEDLDKNIPFIETINDVIILDYLKNNTINNNNNNDKDSVIFKGYRLRISKNTERD